MTTHSTPPSWYQEGIVSTIQDHSAHVNIFLDTSFSRYDPHTIHRLQHVLHRVHRYIVPSITHSGSYFDGERGDVLEIVVGLGIELMECWVACDAHISRTFSRPAGFPKDLCGKFGSIPFTGGDIMLHIKSNRRDLCFVLARAVVDELRAIRARRASVVESVSETYGWTYKRSRDSGIARDISEFEDGTANPHGKGERENAAINHEHGSFCFTSRWVHSGLPWLSSLSVEQQEIDVIGRTRLNSVERKDKSDNAHISRVEVEDEHGEEMEIVRQSMSYGGLNEHGLYFIAYANELDKFSQMLKRMVGENDGDTKVYTGDNLMKFSECKSGQYYYVPSVSELDRFGMRSKL